MLSKRASEIVFSTLTRFASPADAEHLHASIYSVATTDSEALALVALGKTESHFRKDVRRCKITGDGGRSITGWQIQHFGPYTREELCESDKLAAERALAIFNGYVKTCGNVERAFNGYTSGKCRPNAHGQKAFATWERLRRSASTLPTAR